MTKQKFDELPEQWVSMREVPEGGLFRLSKSDTAPVWVRGEYCRQDKQYMAYKYEDVNHERGFGATRKVWVGFEY